uniref:Methionine sulfoxide reductase B1a n=1 Tax=Gasterosteus aculeatus aculeatus TaxID=481459 RepID=A0AAQ4P885_GASAC
FSPRIVLKSLPPILYASGVYVCSKCDHQLFTSRSKYEHSSPWPAFTETVREDSVSKHEERPGAYKVRPEKKIDPFDLTHQRTLRVSALHPCPNRPKRISRDQMF